MTRYRIVLIAAASVVWSVSGVGAAEITLIAPGGIRAAIEQMIPAFERSTGHKVQATFGSGGGTKARVVKGDPFDLPVVQPPLPEVIASGHVDAASETPLANVAVGVAVRTGAPKPDISSADAVKRMLLGAKAIAYPNAASGAANRLGYNAPSAKPAALNASTAAAPTATHHHGGSPRAPWYA